MRKIWETWIRRPSVPTHVSQLIADYQFGFGGDGLFGIGPTRRLRNNGDGTFTDIAAEAGVTDTGMGWSTFFADVDNDGWVDIYVVNESNFTAETKPNVLYQNQGDNTFNALYFARRDDTGSILRYRKHPTFCVI